MSHPLAGLIDQMEMNIRIVMGEDGLVSPGMKPEHIRIQSTWGSVPAKSAMGIVSLRVMREFPVSLRRGPS